MAEEHELIKKHTNEAIQALVPLLDNEKEELSDIAVNIKRKENE